jgi:protein-S-isoprenylcysteine O-methyltransferase Ste14
MSTLLRAYLLAGLVGHKVVWEILKRRQGLASGGPTPSRSVLATLLKAAKVAILAFLVAQTLLPEVLPILEDATPLRILGVPLYTLGLAIAVCGRLQLGDNWADIEAAQVLQHQTVVATGLYRYIRHPIYTGDLIMLLGLELSLNSWLVLGVATLVPYVVRRAVREERMLAERLPGYATYQAATWRFVPFVM